MKAYRIKHIPTGLYFSKTTNFSEVGKVYERKPSINYASGACWVYIRSAKPSKREELLRKCFDFPEREKGKKFLCNTRVVTQDKDWEVEEAEIIGFKKVT